MKQALLLLLFFPVLAYGQFQVNNDAIDLGGGNYQLTNNITYQAGSLWYKLQHNVNDPLTVEGKMYFGTNDAGADGICFVLQNNCLSAGTAGGGIGYAGMPGQSLAVEFDTYQNIAGTGNQDNHDPAYDHLAIEINGNVDHASANNLFGPVRMDSLKPNVEDGQWYDFKITYDPASTTLNIYFNNYLRKSFVYDLKNNLFSNSPYVYWGFTSSTGGFFNQQKIFINGSVSSSSLRDTTLCHGPAPVQFSLPPFTSYQGKNQAVSKKAVASSTESIAFPASNAIDGNMTTRWSSLASDPQWIYVDLITVHDIDSVVLYWETAYGKQYKIQTATDTSAWTDVFFEPAGNGGKDQIIFSAVNVRYIRMLGLQRGTGFGYSLYEFEIYGLPKYVWSPNDGTIDNIYSETPTVTPTATTTYSVAIPDPCGIAVSYNVTITIPLPLMTPVISAGSPTSFCMGGSVALTAATSAPVTYQWAYAGIPIAGASGSTFTADSTGAYTVTVTTTDGCLTTSASAPTLVTANPLPAKPTIAIGGPTTFCTGSNVDLTVSSSTTGLTFQWSNGSTPITDASGKTFTASSSGGYTVKAIDNHSCFAASDTVNVNVFDRQDLIIPNLLTPNGDAMNDCLIILDVNKNDIFPGSSIEIYNRWGEAVHKDDNYSNLQPWCGSSLHEGVYYYYIKTGCAKESIKGWVEIISHEASQ